MLSLLAMVHVGMQGISKTYMLGMQHTYGKHEEGCWKCCIIIWYVEYVKHMLGILCLS